MGWFSDLPLRSRLIGSIAVVLVLLGGVAGWATYQLREQQATYEALLNNEAEGRVLAEQIRLHLMMQQSAQKNVWLREAIPRNSSVMPVNLMRLARG
ncbi:MAG: hypothetical protein U0821_27965 [Chloroflexota bacterium]